MAANFWVSSQRRHWMFTRERLAEIRESLKERGPELHIQLPDIRVIYIFMKTGPLVPSPGIRVRPSELLTDQGKLQNYVGLQSSLTPANKPFLRRKYTSNDSTQKSTSERPIRIWLWSRHSILPVKWKSALNIFGSSAVRLDNCGLVCLDFFFSPTCTIR